MAPPLTIEAERPLDEGTEWIAAHWTESVGLMYSVGSGIVDHELADFHRQLEYLFVPDTLQCVSLQIRESTES